MIIVLMIQTELFKTVPIHRFSLLSKEELIEYIELQQKVMRSFQKKLHVFVL